MCFIPWSHFIPCDLDSVDWSSSSESDHPAKLSVAELEAIQGHLSDRRSTPYPFWAVHSIRTWGSSFLNRVCIRTAGDPLQLLFTAAKRSWREVGEQVEAMDAIESSIDKESTRNYKKEIGGIGIWRRNLGFYLFFSIGETMKDWCLILSLSISVCVRLLCRVEWVIWHYLFVLTWCVILCNCSRSNRQQPTGISFRTPNYCLADYRLRLAFKGWHAAVSNEYRPLPRNIRVLNNMWGKWARWIRQKTVLKMSIMQ